MPYELAALRAGVARSAFTVWRNSTEPVDVEFMAEVEAANAEMLFECLERLADAKEKQWQRWAWKMERRFPEHFGRGVDQAALIAAGSNAPPPDDEVDVSTPEKLVEAIRRAANGD